MPLFGGADGLTYQQALRALGWFLDREGYQNCRIIEQEDGLVLQVARAGEEPHGFQSFLLTRDELIALARDAAASRAQPPGSPESTPA
jgi:hypothetical protein